MLVSVVAAEKCRIAEDCAGFGPLLTVALGLGIRAEGLWACERNAALLPVLQRRGYSCIFPDMLQREFHPGCFHATDMFGKSRQFGAADQLDIYLAGTSCRPWTRQGVRQGCSDRECTRPT